MAPALRLSSLADLWLQSALGSWGCEPWQPRPEAGGTSPMVRTRARGPSAIRLGFALLVSLTFATIPATSLRGDWPDNASNGACSETL